MRALIDEFVDMIRVTSAIELLAALVGMVLFVAVTVAFIALPATY